jgi:predicted PP-loop superfamily ATPase
MNFTLNNHLSYSIDDREYGHRTTPYEKFRVSVGKIDPDHYRTSNWLKEQYRAAEIISQEYGNDFVVMFSGGTDSEIVLRAFKHIGVTPRVVFIKFINDYNIEDYNLAVKIAADIGYRLEAVEFDVKNFYHSGEAWELSQAIQCRQIAYLTVYHNILKIGMPAVMGGEMLFKRHVDKAGSHWHYCFRENEDASAMRFSLKYGIPLVNEWFSYTPEMMGYYLDHPAIKRLLSERYNYKLSSVSSKNDILRSLMPSIIDKKKTHGYEHLMGFNGEVYRKLYLSHPKRLESSLDGIMVDTLRQQLFGDQYVGR